MKEIQRQDNINKKQRRMIRRYWKHKEMKKKEKTGKKEARKGKKVNRKNARRE